MSVTGRMSALYRTVYSSIEFANTFGIRANPYLCLGEKNSSLAALGVKRELNAALFGFGSHPASSPNARHRHVHIHVHVHASHVHAGHVHVYSRSG